MSEGEKDAEGLLEGAPTADFPEENQGGEDGWDGDLFGAEVEGAAARAGLRGPGRPKGALNKKTEDFERFYFAQGFEDPLVGMGKLISTNPLDLWVSIREWHKKLRVKNPPGFLDVLRLQQAVRAEIAPYLHGKMPIRHEISIDQLPTLMLALGTDQISEAERMLDGSGMLLVGQALDMSENNDLAGGEAGSLTGESLTDEASD